MQNGYNDAFHPNSSNQFAGEARVVLSSASIRGIYYLSNGGFWPIAKPRRSSELHLLRKRQGVIDLDAKISNGALNF